MHADEIDLDDLSGSETESLQEIRARLKDFDSFVRERLDEVETLLAEWRSGYGQVVECPCCLQEALKTDCDVVCAFCGYKGSAEDAAELHVSNGGGAIHCCPNCENQALVYHEYGGEEARCFSCGESFSDLELCDLCSEPFPSGDLSGGMCLDCCRAWISADHR